VPQITALFGSRTGRATTSVLELTPEELREIDYAQIHAAGARYTEAAQRMIDR
jgi:hypothetical protein